MIISSQRYLDEEIVAQKIEAIQGQAEISLPAWAVGAVDGRDDLAILRDGHHRYEAAKRLGIAVKFEIDEHPERLTGENLLEGAWMDDDYYDVETGKTVW